GTATALRTGTRTATLAGTETRTATLAGTGTGTETALRTGTATLAGTATVRDDPPVPVHPAARASSRAMVVATPLKLLTTAAVRQETQARFPQGNRRRSLSRPMRCR
ncbi:MAG: hypothetical protein VW937_08295, partial [Actinomycetota bacterium]